MPRGKPFKKGCPGGPGKPKGMKNSSTKIEKQLSSLKRNEYSVRILQLMELNARERKNFLKRLTVPSWEQMVVALIDKGVKTGCPLRAEKIFTLVFGPQKQPIELSDKDGKPLIPQDADLTGKNLTKAIDLVRQLMDAKRAGKLNLPRPKK